MPSMPSRRGRATRVFRHHHERIGVTDHGVTVQPVRAGTRRRPGNSDCSIRPLAEAQARIVSPPIWTGAGRSVLADPVRLVGSIEIQCDLTRPRPRRSPGPACLQGEGVPVNQARAAPPSHIADFSVLMEKNP